MIFLKAEWKKLILINYAVDPQILQKYLPHHTEIDIWNDTCYVSIVGFLFANTQVMGARIPFHIDFEEVNLRFYVKHKGADGWKRGVVFIKEIVPKAAITFVANTLYGEHYHTMPMKHVITGNDQKLTVEYSWQLGKEWQKIRVEVLNQSLEIAEHSEAEFITEHYWGYTKINDQKTFEYGVQHPRWEQYEVLNYDIQIDFERLYGTEWQFLQTSTPLSVVLAEGSKVSVGDKSTL